MVAEYFRQKRELLFITDEPTAYCDVQARKLIWQEIEKISEYNNCVLVATNDLNEAREISSPAGKISFINNGSISFFGTLDSLRKHFGLTSSTLSIQLSNNIQSDVFTEKLEKFESELHEIHCELLIRKESGKSIVIQNVSESDIGNLMHYSTFFFEKIKIPILKIERREPELEDLFT